MAKKKRDGKPTDHQMSVIMASGKMTPAQVKTIRTYRDAENAIKRIKRASGGQPKGKTVAKKAVIKAPKAQKKAQTKQKAVKPVTEELPLKKGDVFKTPDGRTYQYSGNGMAKPQKPTASPMAIKKNFVKAGKSVKPVLPKAVLPAKAKKDACKCKCGDNGKKCKCKAANAKRSPMPKVDGVGVFRIPLNKADVLHAFLLDVAKTAIAILDGI